MKKIIISTGEPSGIGPEISIKSFKKLFFLRKYLFFIGDKDLLKIKSYELNINIKEMNIIHVPLRDKNVFGILNIKNSPYVIELLNKCITYCKENKFCAMVTCPVSKSIINKFGILFTGHTEYIAKKLDNRSPIMMLIYNSFRVALLTTHIPIKNISNYVKKKNILDKIISINNFLKRIIKNPKIAVLGLNPHAGEDGFIGDEEIKEINPAIDAAQKLGINVHGSFSPDTIYRKSFDVYLAMYHDQALPVIKLIGFHNIINITLNIDIIRTSVDHGIGIDISKKNIANSSSLEKAISFALNITKNITKN